MTLENKQDLDALLRRWPALAPGKAKGVIEHEDNADWEARADAIVGAALAAKAGDAKALEALEASPLPIELGEPEKAVGGEKKMSQENEPGGPPTSGEPSAAPVTTGSPATSTPVPERKRTSLKALAEKANQASRPGATPSSPSGHAPTSTPVPSAPSLSARAATSTPLPRPQAGSQASPRPKEAGAEDSGIVNLHVVRDTATAQQIADAEKAKPGSEGLFDEDKPGAAKAANVIPIASAKAAPKKSNGPLIGFAIAAIGVAAAFAIIKMQKPPAPAVSTEAKPAVTAVAPEAQPVERAAPTAVAAAEPAAAPSTEPGKGDAPRVAGGPLPNSGAGAAAPKDAPVDDGKVAAVEKPSAPVGKPGDLKSEMARAVGADGKPVDGAGGTPEPAAGNAKGQNLPEQPSQGAAQSAVGAVIGGAKACVAGADDVSRANVTFASNGTVSNVTVSGWAAEHGKSACVQAALKGAKVGPFSKSSFTLGFPIRP